MQLLLVVLFVAGLATASKVFIDDPKPPHGQSLSVNTETVNLDLPPEMRWVALSEKYKVEMTKVVDWVFDFFPKHLLPYVEAIMSDLDLYLGVEYRKEIEGVAAGSGLDLVLLQGRLL